jgi:uncharacterized protein YcgI (DUF1989 family)
MDKPAAINRVMVPAAHGGTIDVKKGQYISVLDVKGGQVADFWAFDRNDMDHYLSPAHFIIAAMRTQPKVGDKIVTNRRDPIVTVVHDGVKGHRNCCDNFREALQARGIDWGLRQVPLPFNIFMNTLVKEDGTLVIRVPTSNAGDRIIMQAEMDILVVTSSCPMDLNETGARGISEIELLVSDSLEALQNA